ncbi:MAG: hypothetical protein LUQ16_08595 [Methanomassiliicoccales archaeon]|jgi:hypothetical protein|nr:hypothetical protein [Methanomassiliicoccales archaeon]MDD1756055.1 hypothetical protein [Methanomassiliicoccales archaeon]
MPPNQREKTEAEKNLILATDLIKDCMLSCYEELVRSEGAERVYSAINLYCVHGGYAASIILKERLGIRSSRPEDVAKVWSFMHNSFRRKPEVVIGPDYCISFLRHCSHLSSGPEVCMLECVAVARGVADSFGTDQDFDMTTSIADHDDRCTQIFKNRTMSSSKIMMEMDKASAGDVSLGDVTEEEALSYYRAYLSEMWLWVVKTSNDLIGGERTLNLFKEKMYRLGMRWGSLLHRQLSDSRNRELGVAELIDGINGLFQQKGGEVVVMKSGSFKEIEVCPFSSALPEMCKIIEEFMNGVLTAVDANQQFRYQRMMNAGDASCLWMLGQVRL